MTTSDGITQKNNITVNQTVNYTFNNDDKTVILHISTEKTEHPELRYVQL